jgi:hypothetical protein
MCQLIKQLAAMTLVLMQSHVSFVILAACAIKQWKSFAGRN